MDKAKVIRVEFPLIKLAKKLKALNATSVAQVGTFVSIN